RSPPLRLHYRGPPRYLPSFPTRRSSDLATIETLAGLAREIAARDGAITAAAFRDVTGLGRKRAIQILEFFDRVGLLRRVGDRHLDRKSTRLNSSHVKISYAVFCLKKKNK